MPGFLFQDEDTNFTVGYYVISNLFIRFDQILIKNLK